MIIKRLSASKLDTFIVCPYGFYLKYVKRKVKRNLQTSGMQLGTLVHKILEEFHRAIQAEPLPTEEGALKQLIYLKAKEKTIEYTTIYNNTYKRKRQNSAFIFNNYVNPFIIYYVKNGLHTKKAIPEFNFSKTLGEIAATIDATKLEPGWEKYKDVLAVGKMDLLIEPDLIFDYKVQNPNNFQKDIIDNFQTLLYTLIFERDMTFVYLFLNRTITPKVVMISQESRPDKFNKIIKVLKILENTTSFKKNPKNCTECLFKSVCKKA